MNTVRTFRVTRLVSALAFSVSMLALNATAFAEPAPVTKVSYADLNLNNSADVKVLYRRLADASAAACGFVDKNILSASTHWERCYSVVLEKAVLQVPSRALYALYQDKKVHNADLS